MLQLEWNEEDHYQFWKTGKHFQKILCSDSHLKILVFWGTKKPLLRTWTVETGLKISFFIQESMSCKWDPRNLKHRLCLSAVIPHFPSFLHLIGFDQHRYLWSEFGKIFVFPPSLPTPQLFLLCLLLSPIHTPTLTPPVSIEPNSLPEVSCFLKDVFFPQHCCILHAHDGMPGKSNAHCDTAEQCL